MYARARQKPLWKLIVDFTPVCWLIRCFHDTLVLKSSFLFLPQEEFVNSVAFRYISDAITKEEALEMLKQKETTKKEREELVREIGYVIVKLLFAS